MFDLYNEKQLSGCIMFADFKKAFDSTEWEFVFKTLSKFNFGNSFQQWIKILYTNPSAVIKNNGHLSDEFELTRGVRQGCPVSALLFILCMEVLASHIRQNNNIIGLHLDNERVKNIKILQYADDATFFIKNSNDMREVIKSLTSFGSVAGTELNLSKCEGLWLGTNKNRQHNCTLYNMKWPLEPIRYLGIYIGHDSAKCDTLNFNDKLLQIDNVLKHAEKRTLTLFGKVCIIKSLALLKIIYVATCLSIPEKVIKEIDQRIFKFLWGKRDRVKRKSIINNLQSGGLNMVDVRTQFNAIKASWVCRITNAPDDHLWAYLPKSYISKFGANYYILKTPVTQKTAFLYLNTIPNFYKEVIFAYNSSKISDIEDFFINLKTQPIWGNKFIKFRNKTLFFKSWIRSGITAIGNLKIVNGMLDVAYLMNRIQDHRNFYSEINILQLALSKANIRESIDPIIDISLPNYVVHTDEIFEWESRRAKYYYNNIIEGIKIRPTSERFWSSKTGITEDEIQQAYLSKIKQIKDKKLAETYFKILNNILPCNKLLLKWGKSDTAICSFCNEEETISHLLFECQNAQSIWTSVNNILHIENEITLNMVIFGTGLDISLSHVFSIVAYYIYKDFVVCSFEKKVRQVFSIICFKNYLTIRKNIYEKCTSIVLQNVCSIINTLLNGLET